MRGDNDPPAACVGLKPKRLTPGAVGGLTFDGVRFDDAGWPTAAAAADADASGTVPAAGGGGSPPLLAAVRGERALSAAFAGTHSEGVPPAAPPKDDRPSNSFSLPSYEARRGLRRVPCLLSNMSRQLGLGGARSCAPQDSSASGVVSPCSFSGASAFRCSVVVRFLRGRLFSVFRSNG